MGKSKKNPQSRSARAGLQVSSIGACTAERAVEFEKLNDDDNTDCFLFADSSPSGESTDS